MLEAQSVLHVAQETVKDRQHISDQVAAVAGNKFRSDMSSSANPGLLCSEVISLIGGRTMDPLNRSRPYLSRRNILKSSALAVPPLAIAPAN